MVRPEFIALWVLASLGVFQGLSWAIRFLRRRGRSRGFRPVAGRGHRRGPIEVGKPDASDQLREVMSATFTPRKVMSMAEYRVFKIAEEVVAARRSGYRVFAQTSLGEVISGDNPRAHSAINSKRVDVLVISPSGLPALAVEYQGGEHYQGQAAARDAVKREALRRAGVDYVEVAEHHSPEQVRALIAASLDRTGGLQRVG